MQRGGTFARPFFSNPASGRDLETSANKTNGLFQFSISSSSRDCSQAVELLDAGGGVGDDIGWCTMTVGRWQGREASWRAGEVCGCLKTEKVVSLVGQTRRTGSGADKVESFSLRGGGVSKALQGD